MAFRLHSPAVMQRRQQGVNDKLKHKADRTLDFRDSVTPLALLKFTNVFNEMKPDEVLECIGQNPKTMTDFFLVLPSVSYEIVIKEEFENRYFRILLKKLTIP